MAGGAEPGSARIRSRTLEPVDDASPSEGRPRFCSNDESSWSFWLSARDGAAVAGWPSLPRFDRERRSLRGGGTARWAGSGGGALAAADGGGRGRRDSPDVEYSSGGIPLISASSCGSIPAETESLPLDEPVTEPAPPSKASRSSRPCAPPSTSNSDSSDSSSASILASSAPPPSPSALPLLRLSGGALRPWFRESDSDTSSYSYTSSYSHDLDMASPTPSTANRDETSATATKGSEVVGSGVDRWVDGSVTVQVVAVALRRGAGRG